MLQASVDDSFSFIRTDSAISRSPLFRISFSARRRHARKRFQSASINGRLRAEVEVSLLMCANEKRSDGRGTVD